MVCIREAESITNIRVFLAFPLFLAVVKIDLRSSHAQLCWVKMLLGIGARTKFLACSWTILPVGPRMWPRRYYILKGNSPRHVWSLCHSISHVAKPLAPTDNIITRGQSGPSLLVFQALSFWLERVREHAKTRDADQFSAIPAEIAHQNSSRRFSHDSLHSLLISFAVFGLFFAPRVTNSSPHCSYCTKTISFAQFADLMARNLNLNLYWHASRCIRGRRGGDDARALEIRLPVSVIFDLCSLWAIFELSQEQRYFSLFKIQDHSVHIVKKRVVCTDFGSV